MEELGNANRFGLEIFMYKNEQLFILKLVMLLAIVTNPY